MKQRQEANLIHAAHAPRVFDRVWPILFWLDGRLLMMSVIFLLLPPS